MQKQAAIQGELEQQRADFVRVMEANTPREVLKAIEYVEEVTPQPVAEWPEFVTQTHGACYAG